MCEVSILKDHSDGVLHYSGIISIKVSNEEECDVLKNADECEHKDFFLNEGYGFSKVFLRNKALNEEEEDE